MKTAKETFEEWASDDRAQRMGEHHWGLIQQGFALLPRSDGPYLEIGVGNGYGLRHMAEHQHANTPCLGIDVSPKMVALAQQNLEHLARKSTLDLAQVEIRCTDFMAQDFCPQLRFATIFSMEVFYYFEDIQRGIDKAVSLMAPDGRLMVMVDFYEENPVSHGWPDDLQTPMVRWSSQQYEDGFAAAGLVDVKQYRYIDSRNPDWDAEDQGSLCTVGQRSGRTGR